MEVLAQKSLKPARQPRAPQHGQVGLRRGAHVLEGVQVAEAHLGDERAAVHAHAADGLGDPLRVAREQVLVLGRAGELDHAELHDEVVHELLDLLLGEGAARQVALRVDVDEGRGAADRHRRAVLILDRREVGEVHPLDGLLGVRRRAHDVEPVDTAELGQLVQGADLLGELLAVADDGLGHGVRRGGLLGLLVADEEVQAVERHAAVVADDAAAAVAVGQAGDDVRAAAGAHLGLVDVEDALVVGLALGGVDVHDLGVDLVAVLLGRLAGDADAAVHVQGALERAVGLQADDRLQLGVVGVDVAGRIRRDARHDLRLHVEDAAELALALEQAEHGAPEPLGALGRPCQERAVALVGGVVALDEVAHVDLVGPDAPGETFPCLLHFGNHAPRGPCALGARVGGYSRRSGRVRPRTGSHPTGDRRWRAEGPAAHLAGRGAGAGIVSSIRPLGFKCKPKITYDRRIQSVSFIDVYVHLKNTGPRRAAEADASHGPWRGRADGPRADVPRCRRARADAPPGRGRGRRTRADAPRCGRAS